MVPGLLAREDCPSGWQYYVCASSNFKGCCDVDACDYTDGCPDVLDTTVPTVAVVTTAAVGTPVQLTTAVQETSAPAMTTVQGTTAVTAITENPKTITTSRRGTTDTQTAQTAQTSQTATGIPTTLMSTTTTTATSTAAHSSQSTMPSLSTSTPSALPDQPSPTLSKGTVAGIAAAGLLFLLIVAALIFYKMGYWAFRSRPRQSPNSALEDGTGLDKTGGLGKSNNAGGAGSPNTNGSSDDGSNRISELETPMPPPGLAAGTWQGKARARGHRGNADNNPRPDGNKCGLWMSPPIHEAPADNNVTELGNSEVVKLYYELATSSSSSPSSPPTPWTPAPSALSPLTSPGRASLVTTSSHDAPSTPDLVHHIRPVGADRAPPISMPMPSTQPTSQTERPRATLDVTPVERDRGVHVASWGSYQP